VAAAITKMEDGGTSEITRDASQEHGANHHHMAWRESITLREHAVIWEGIHSEDKIKTRLDGLCHWADTRADQLQEIKSEVVVVLLAMEAVAEVDGAAAVAGRVVVMPQDTAVKFKPIGVKLSKLGPWNKNNNYSQLNFHIVLQKLAMINKQMSV